MAYFFGLGQGHLSDAVAAIAEENDADLVNYTEPDGRQRHWFECANYGQPHDQNKANAVWAALEESGVNLDPIDDDEEDECE